MKNQNQKQNSEAVEGKRPAELYPEGGEITFVMPNTNTLGKLKDAKKGAKLTAQYMRVEDWKQLIGQEKNFFYLGFKNAVDSQGDHYALARLIDSEGNPYVSAPTILTQSLSNLPIGQGVSITCTEVRKNNSGGYTPYFDVVRLEINIFGNGTEPQFDEEN